MVPFFSALALKHAAPWCSSFSTSGMCQPLDSSCAQCTLASFSGVDSWWNPAVHQRKYLIMLSSLVSEAGFLLLYDTGTSSSVNVLFADLLLCPLLHNYGSHLRWVPRHPPTACAAPALFGCSGSIHRRSIQLPGMRPWPSSVVQAASMATTYCCPVARMLRVRPWLFDTPGNVHRPDAHSDFLQ